MTDVIDQRIRVKRQLQIVDSFTWTVTTVMECRLLIGLLNSDFIQLWSASRS